MAEAGDFGALFDTIIDALRADTGTGSLVDLTNHDSRKQSGFRIYRAESTQKPRMPSICVDILGASPMSEDATYFQRALVTFKVVTNSKVLGLNIVKRIFNIKPTLTFTSTSIAVKEFNYLETNFSEYKDNEDYYEFELLWEFFFTGSPCP